MVVLYHKWHDGLEWTRNVLYRGLTLDIHTTLNNLIGPYPYHVSRVYRFDSGYVDIRGILFLNLRLRLGGLVGEMANDKIELPPLKKHAASSLKTPLVLLLADFENTHSRTVVARSRFDSRPTIALVEYKLCQ